jgi:hypothetical protein
MMLRCHYARYCTSQEAQDYWQNGKDGDSTTDQKMVAVHGLLYAPTPPNIYLFIYMTQSENCIRFGAVCAGPKQYS